PLPLLTGHELVVVGISLAGGHGSVPGLGNVDPAGYVRMERAARAGDFEALRHEQDRLARLFDIVFGVQGKTGPAQGVGAFKTALYLMGIFTTNTMASPMTPLEGKNVDRVRAVLTEAGSGTTRWCRRPGPCWPPASAARRAPPGWWSRVGGCWPWAARQRG